MTIYSLPVFAISFFTCPETSKIIDKVNLIATLLVHILIQSEYMEKTSLGFASGCGQVEIVLISVCYNVVHNSYIIQEPKWFEHYTLLHAYKIVTYVSIFPHPVRLHINV